MKQYLRNINTKNAYSIEILRMNFLSCYRLQRDGNPNRSRDQYRSSFVANMRKSALCNLPTSDPCQRIIP